MSQEMNATSEITPDNIKSSSRQVWRCDVCNVAVFDTFEEAVEHETSCRGVGDACDGACENGEGACETNNHESISPSSNDAEEDEECVGEDESFASNNASAGGNDSSSWGEGCVGKKVSGLSWACHAGDKLLGRDWHSSKYSLELRNHASPDDKAIPSSPPHTKTVSRLENQERKENENDQCAEVQAATLDIDKCSASSLLEFDVAKSALFKNYDEAKAHEEKCQGATMNLSPPKQKTLSEDIYSIFSPLVTVTTVESKRHDTLQENQVRQKSSANISPDITANEKSAKQELRDEQPVRIQPTKRKRFDKALSNHPTGVTEIKASGKWRVSVWYAGKLQHIGYFDSKYDAISANEAARNCVSSFKESVSSPDQAKRNVELMKKAASRFNPSKKRRVDNDGDESPAGLFKIKSSGKWLVQVRYAGKTRHVGSFDSKQNAVSANKAARDCLSSFNKEDLLSPDDVKRNVEEMKQAASRFKSLKKRQVDYELPKGVSLVASGKWRVDVQYARKTCFVGYFDSKENAVSANKAARDCLSSFNKEDLLSPDDVKRNVEEMKQAASRFKSLKKRQVDYELPKGVSLVASGKWQVEVGYAGKTRYIGRFASKEDAISANKAARESMYSFSESDMTSPDQVKRNVEEMKEAASRFNSPKKKGLDSDDDELPTGVTKAKASGKWLVQVFYAGKPRHIGSFDSREYAVSANNAARDCLGSFKESDLSIPEHVQANVKLMKKKASRFKSKKKGLVDNDGDESPAGLFKIKSSGKWRVSVWYAGKPRFIGDFSSKEYAISANKAARDCLSSFKESDMSSPEQVQANVELMKKSASSINPSKKTSSRVNRRRGRLAGNQSKTNKPGLWNRSIPSNEAGNTLAARATEEIQLDCSNRSRIAKLPVAFGFLLDDKGTSKETARLAHENWVAKGIESSRIETEESDPNDVDLERRSAKRQKTIEPVPQPKIVTASEVVHLTTLNKNDIATLPVAFGFWLDNVSSIGLAQAASEQWTADGIKAVNSLDCDPESALPQGWTTKTSGRGKGSTYYSPENKYTFRSLEKALAFVEILKEPGINGDEKEAWERLKRMGHK